MKDTSDRLIYALLILLLIFGILAFFKVPMYEKGTWLIVEAIVAALSGLFGFKFGVHQTKVPDGTMQLTQTPPAAPAKEEIQQ